ncbi:nucleotidyltransferase domain-containing protein [Pseudomonas sp. GNP014]
METISLSEALFTTTQQKVLGLMFGKPDQTFYANEIVRWARVGKGSLMRELDRLQRAGVLRMTKVGNQNHYQANPTCPIYAELLGIARKTFGIAEPLRRALQPFTEQITWAFVYGSIAKDTANTLSDIDLMLIGEGLHYSDVMERLMPMEEQLGRPINPTLYTPQDLAAKLAGQNSFVLRVVQQEKIVLLGANPLESKDGQQRESGESST